MSDDAITVQRLEAELHRCMAQRDDAMRTLARVQRELRQALDGRESEYHRAEAALDELSRVRGE